jgi:hypothetical protein
VTVHLDVGGKRHAVAGDGGTGVLGREWGDRRRAWAGRQRGGEKQKGERRHGESGLGAYQPIRPRSEVTCATWWRLCHAYIESS